MADRRGAFYPIVLRLRDRRVLVVGGGTVAARKAAGLLAAGARVVAVSPVFSPAFRRLGRSGDLACIRRRYAARDLAGMALVVAATDDAAVNARVSADARRAGVFTNIVDAPGASDFIVPAILRRGNLLIAVSTGGASPGVAGHLRRVLGQLVPAEYTTLLELLRQARARVRRTIADGARRRQVMRWLVAKDVIATLRRGGRGAARRRIEALLATAASSRPHARRRAGS